MKAYIYTGGGVLFDRISLSPTDCDIVISADAGYLSATSFGITPSIAVGDFDTLGEYDFSPLTEVVRLPAEKDESDTEAAVNIALARGADEIVIVGGLDGRLDHTLANIRIVETLSKKGVSAYITDGRNRVRYIENTSAVIAKEDFKYLSLICVSQKARGVMLKGVKYPLNNATLLRENASFSISNEVVESFAVVSVKRGALYVIESTDK